MSDLTPKEVERLMRLKERAEFLGERIQDFEKRDKKHLSHRDRAERSALLWAIDIIENLEVVEDQ